MEQRQSCFKVHNSQDCWPRLERSHWHFRHKETSFGLSEMFWGCYDCIWKPTVVSPVDTMKIKLFCTHPHTQRVQNTLTHVPPSMLTAFTKNPWCLLYFLSVQNTRSSWVQVLGPSSAPSTLTSRGVTPPPAQGKEHPKSAASASTHIKLVSCYVYNTATCAQTDFLHGWSFMFVIYPTADSDQGRKKTSGWDFASANLTWRQPNQVSFSWTLALCYIYIYIYI